MCRVVQPRALLYGKRFGEASEAPTQIYSESSRLRGARADEGVVPGQWGNWSQSRAGWCPGLPVETVRFDITSQVTLIENTVTYEASFNGGELRGGDIAKNTYIVWYQD